MSKPISAESLFLAGHFTRVTDAFVDAGTSSMKAADVPWVLGSLVFQGRIEEAKLLFARKRRSISEVGLFCASFFLGVGEARASRYDAARRTFTENLLRLRKMLKTAHSESHDKEQATCAFFAWQGVSFFRHLGCRYLASLSSSAKAFDAAFLWGVPLARTLAADLRGHVLVRVGQVSEGLRLLEWAQEFATSHGLGGFAGASSVSRLNYEAQHGRNPHGDLERLQANLASLTLEDCYSRASLNVELARQFLLRGKALEARGCLDEAEPFLEARGQRRQKCSLWHRRASLEFWEGRFDAALACLEKAEGVTDARMDLTKLLEIQGLKMRCLEEMGQPVPTALRSEVEVLTQRTGGRVAWRILSRHRGESKGEGSEDDPLGSLLDRVEREFRLVGSRRQAQRLIEDLLASGYLLLLPRVLGYRPGQRAIVLEVRPGALLVIDGAGVEFQESGSSAQVRSLLLALARGPLSKQQIVEWIWGYRYLGDSHDPLVYALIKRLRRLLGARQGWLASRDGCYSLEEGVFVRVHEPGLGPVEEGDSRRVVSSGGNGGGSHSLTARPETARSNTGGQHHVLVPQSAWQQSLNHRQILMLEWIAENRFAGVSEIMKAFQVSKATANRDLAPLLEKGLVRKSGSARATRYEAQPLELGPSEGVVAL